MTNHGRTRTGTDGHWLVALVALATCGCVVVQPQTPAGPEPGESGGSSVVVPASTGRVMRAVTFGWDSVNPAAYGGWSGKLPDCEFDATFAADMWRSFGVATTTLLTRAATRDACKAALRWGLEGLSTGDWLIVWISGHGGQTDDASGDEADGLDEYVCAYDGPVMDDTIAEWLAEVPPGVCILWVCDTCHSGTMHRPARFRARAIPQSFKGGLILISGCTEAGTSQSTGQGGVLSIALHDTGPEDMTPKSWAAAARGKIPAETQQPQYVEYGAVTDAFRNGVIVPKRAGR